MSPVRFELQNFYPRVNFFEFDNKYIIRCFLLKYRLIFLLVFLYLTHLKARQILSRPVKNISLYFKRRHLIIHIVCFVILFYNNKRVDRSGHVDQGIFHYFPPNELIDNYSISWFKFLF